MSSRNVLILGIVAILALAAGLWLAGRQTSAVPGDSRGALYPGLENELDVIEAVRIFKAGNARAVELKHGEAGWSVTERAGYRADETKLRRLVRAIAEAAVLEEKTSNPERYAALGVEDTGKPDAKGVRVELAGTARPANLIVGNTGPGASSRYVRRAGEAQSWLIDQAIDAPAEPDAWLAKEIADIPADRVQAVTVTAQGGKRYTAAKASRGDEHFNVEKLPKGKSLRSPTVADSLATALSGLELSDVQPRSEFGAEPPADRASYRTFDGLVVEAEGWKSADKRYIALKATFDGAQAQRFEAAPKAGEAKPVAPDVEGEARTLATKTAGWVYEIAEYRYQSLFKPIDDLL
jgi:hypothetical protein